MRCRAAAVCMYVHQAEEIRTRRDHEAWLSRVEGGLDTPIQDPLSLLGGCVESTRRLKETFAVDRMRCGEGVPPRQADSRETEDRSSKRCCYRRPPPVLCILL